MNKVNKLVEQLESINNNINHLEDDINDLYHNKKLIEEALRIECDHSNIEKSREYDGHTYVTYYKCNQCNLWLTYHDLKINLK